MADSLLTMTGSGFYCPAGDFYIDPWRPVANAIITHAHADHARVGMEKIGYPLDSPDPNLLCRPLCGFCAAD